MRSNVIEYNKQLLIPIESLEQKVALAMDIVGGDESFVKFFSTQKPI